LSSVHRRHSVKTLFAECQVFDTRQRLTAVSCRRPLTALCRAHLCRVLAARQSSLCRVFLCAECPALGKQALYQAQYFAECPIKSTRQRACHSAKARISVVHVEDRGRCNTPRNIFSCIAFFSAIILILI
jgi:hypothetical protein